MVHRADPPARPVGEYIADQDQGRGRGDKAGAEAAMRRGPEASGRCRAARPASQTAEVAATAASMAPRGGGGGRASAPVRRLTLDRHDAERKQLRREGEAEQAVEALGREGERQGKQRAADARLVPR